MPRVRVREIPFVKMQRLLMGYGLNGVKLGEILGVTHVTAKRKIDNPERLTLADIDRINRYAHIPMEELREAVVK